MGRLSLPCDSAFDRARGPLDPIFWGWGGARGVIIICYVTAMLYFIMSCYVIDFVVFT